MDGTIFDLYGEPNWLPRLRREESGLFENLKPLISEEELLKAYPLSVYDIAILTMLPKGASEEYCEVVTLEKEESLRRHFPRLSQVKQIYQRYGENKNKKNCSKAILIDDNEKIRNNWRGVAIAPYWI